MNRTIARYAALTALPAAATATAATLLLLTNLALSIPGSRLLLLQGTNLPFFLGISLAALAATATGITWARRQPTTSRAIATTISLGTAIVVILVALSDTPTPGAVATDLPALATWILLTALTIGATTITRHRYGTRAAATAAVLGTLITLELATTLAGLIHTDPHEVDRALAPLWYPATAFALDIDPGHGGLWILADQIELLPALLTLPSAFVLGYLLATAARGHRAS